MERVTKNYTATISFITFCNVTESDFQRPTVYKIIKIKKEKKTDILG